MPEPWREDYGPSGRAIESRSSDTTQTPASGPSTWSDSNDRWHLYDLVGPARHVDELIDELTKVGMAFRPSWE